MSKDILKTLSMDLSLISEYNISEEYFYDNFSKSLFGKMKEQQEKGYKMYNLNSHEMSKLKDSKYLLKENIKGHLSDTKDKTLRYMTHDVLSSSIEKVKDKNINLTNLIEGTKEILTDINYSNAEDVELEDNTHYIEEYKKQTKEIEESNETRFYTFPSHPVLKKHLRIQKGWYINLISPTSGGKSVVSAMLAIDFVKTYDEFCLYVTDENLKETIKEYMLSHYFNLSISDIQTRKIKIDEYIENLPEDEKTEYNRIFSKIIVWELSGINTDKVKSYIKSRSDIGLLVVDSGEEINSLSTIYKDEITRYDASAKILESMTKELGIITLATLQLGTQYYGISAEKLPLICNYNSKQMVKKAFISLVMHCIFDKDGNVIDEVMKISKNRSGDKDILYRLIKKYSHMQLIPDEHEYDLTEIKNKSTEMLDF